MCPNLANKQRSHPPRGEIEQALWIRQCTDGDLENSHFRRHNKIWWECFESRQRNRHNEGTWDFQELTLLRKTKWGGRLRGFCFLTMKEKSTHLILHPKGDDLKLDECTGMSPGNTEHGCYLWCAQTQLVSIDPERRVDDGWGSLHLSSSSVFHSLALMGNSIWSGNWRQRTYWGLGGRRRSEMEV